ncbi:MAG: response regulator, partial [Clostridia bacterium]
MYRLVIVDDEKDIREHLKYLITASPISFQIMSEYENGIDAYEGITNDFPDLVITDIKIPYIDGISLAKNIKEIMPLVKIAFVTGYDEFDYAKQAANIGVVGFVSKPITQDNINEILKRAEDALNAEREVASSMGHLQAYYNKNISAIRSSDLYRLTNMSEVSTEFAEKLRLNGINLDFPFMTLAVVDFDKIYPESTDVNEFAYSLLEKLLSEEPSSCGVGQLFVDVFNRSEKICAIIKSNTKISSGGVERLFELFIARVKKFTNVSLSVGLSKTWQS